MTPAEHAEVQLADTLERLRRTEGTLDVVSAKWEECAKRATAAEAKLATAEKQITAGRRREGEFAQAIGLDGWEYGAKDIADRWTALTKCATAAESALADAEQLRTELVEALDHALECHEGAKNCTRCEDCHTTLAKWDRAADPEKAVRE